MDAVARRKTLRELSKTELLERLLTLEELFADIHWMARRYADRRASCAVSTYNDAIKKAQAMGVKLSTCDGSIYARDGMGRSYDGLPEAEVGKLEANGDMDFCDGCRIKSAAVAMAEKVNLNDIPEKQRQTICKLVAEEFKR